MKQLLLSSFLAFFGLCANAQDVQSLRTSLMQYQFNSLPLNPAYAGRLEATSFEAFYFGSFASDQQISRSAMLSLHGRGGVQENLGWGGVLQFHNQAAYNEMNFHPTFSRIVHLANSNVSFGANLGISYFDVDESVVTTINSSFFSLDGGLGALWHNQRSFVGVSILNFFEKSFNADSDKDFSLPRSRPINFHAGSLFRINDEIYLKPAVLLRYSENYGIPEPKSHAQYSLVAADVHASVFIEGSYVVGLLVGYAHPELGNDQTRFGASATLLFGNFRLGYALQFNKKVSSQLNLPSTHTISAGYDFFENPADGHRVF